MPTVTLNRKTVEQLLGKKITTKELRHHITYLGTDVGDVNAKEIVVEIFPNRPDLLSEQGMARALKTKMGLSKGLTRYKVKKSSYVVKVTKHVEGVRPFTRCAVIKNITITPQVLEEIIQIQEKLHITFGRRRAKVAIGVYPLDKITFPITYTAQNPKDIVFVPLDELKEMNGLQVCENHPKGKEFAHLLEGKKVYPVFRDATQKVLSLPPIINSDEMGKVNTSTKDLFVECSGTTELALEQGIAMLASALCDMGGEIHEVSVEQGTKNIISPDFSPKKLRVDIQLVNSMLGLDLSGEQIAKLVEKMDMDAEVKKDELIVSYPVWRTDILHQVDVIEDIAIAYGYENFKPILPNITTTGRQDVQQLHISRIAELFVGIGITEVSPLVISPQASMQDKVLKKEQVVLLKNPATSEYNCLRNWLVSSLLDTLQNNKSHEYPQKIFCVGRVVNTDGKKVFEDERIAVALAQDGINFTNVKQVCEFLSQQIGIAFSYKALKHSTFMDGRTAQLYAGKKVVGLLGEIHPNVLVNFELTVPVAVCELYMDQLSELIK